MNAKFGILYEDDDVLVVDKPADLLCHPASKRPYPNLIQWVREYLDETLNPQPSTLDPQLSVKHSAVMVNRLDRETSGIVIVAKSARMTRKLGKQIQKRQVEKEYQAIVYGLVAPDNGLLEKPIGRDTRSRVWIKQAVDGEDALPCITAFEVEQRLDQFTLLRLRPRTGRMHQVRVHLAAAGHPIVGDKLYGADENLYLEFCETSMTESLRAKLLLPRHALHACRVKFLHPWKNEFVVCAAPLPEDMAEFVRLHGVA